MEEKLLKQMSAIVDSNMEAYKSDFYTYDLALLYSYDKTPEFWWEVYPTHSHILCVSSERLEQLLRKNAASRFSFMDNPESFIYGGFKYYLINYGKYSKFYHYTSEKGLVATTAEEATMQIWDICKPIVEKLKGILATEFGDETKYYGTKVPVRFANEKIRQRFMWLVRNHADGGRLLKRFQQFRNYQRKAIQHEIVISSDFEPTDFTFSDVLEEKCTLFGGIIYSKDSHDWFIHT